ncbi:hypothetical protein M427DRAFT_142455 [Gonapodya prolifera JEL478]|uniref:Large ribosomal subunit protein eL14 domain-containing protein n=1 Tax=Gonapodya prolifera (strain JEL478) TaxID=1344416 RepID=A0A139AXT3_GONPJ|nr:hypothetical protein M427DRAFT_142455 [Gonapodya prolifera JEL478]|eukprot:KXS21383.1 hypothetical protein M427DRAFT_142455 [Gonapodya prolifera JEL478]
MKKVLSKAEDVGGGDIFCEFVFTNVFVTSLRGKKSPLCTQFTLFPELLEMERQTAKSCWTRKRRDGTMGGMDGWMDVIALLVGEVQHSVLQGTAHGRRRSHYAIHRTTYVDKRNTGESRSGDVLDPTTPARLGQPVCLSGGILNVEDLFKRLVEVGRVVLLNYGPDSGKLAVIVDIIDHNRALIDGPTTGVKRQQFAFKRLTLTGLTLSKLARGAGSPSVVKAWERDTIDEKWGKTAWAQKLVRRQKRAALSDFDRFKVLIARKEKRAAVHKALKA